VAAACYPERRRRAAPESEADMRFLLCGDIVGRPGRSVVVEQMSRLRRDLALDFVVANGENAAHGFGITDKICAELYAGGVDVITTGNHVWDRREIIPYIGGDPRLLRPINFPPGTPGQGCGVFALADGRKVLVVNAMARLFMDAIDDPFAGLDKLLGDHPLGRVDAIIVDFHGEATSEKMAMGHFLDGRVSAVVGTHSHVPTADAQILPKGTAYISDAGMCGDYDSVIGMQKDTAVARFVHKMPGERLQVAEGEATLCGAFVETDDATGLARRIAPLRLGGRLEPRWPLGEDVAATVF
jgi:2',3'-cyclic-nucleotide 2'-phosphodiesterase